MTCVFTYAAVGGTNEVGGDSRRLIISTLASVIMVDLGLDHEPEKGQKIEVQMCG